MLAFVTEHPILTMAAAKRDLSARSLYMMENMHLEDSPKMKRESTFSRQPPKDDSYVLVAAIDFGTTFSGYAFSFCTSQEDICMYSKWGENVALQGHKTPTCVLTDKNGVFTDFGYDAESRFADLTDGEDRDYCLYSKFKMTLHKIKVGFM